MPDLRKALEQAITDVGRRIGQDLRLSSEGAIGVRIGDPSVELVIEWIDPAACVAVHAAFAVPPGLGSDAVATALMKSHLGGVGTRGCSFWMLPDESFRVGLTLVGPQLGDEDLLEAMSRVATVASYVRSPVK